MVRSVRNFWVSLDHTSRQTHIGTGPVGPYGEFNEQIYIRENGNVRHALTITGQARRDGKLFLVVTEPETRIELVTLEVQR